MTPPEEERRPSPLPSAREVERARRSRHVRMERSAGGVVVRRIEGRLHLLIIRDPYRNWGLPKGHLEEGEEASEAALREVREETGLGTLDLGPELGTIDWYFRLGEQVVHKYCDFFLMASLEGEPTPEVEEGITEAAWVPLECAHERISYDNAREIVRTALDLLTGDGEPPVSL